MPSKNNIFEHVYYEISEYLFTYNFLRTGISRIDFADGTSSSSQYLQVAYNCIWTSHFVHMRNLIDFFGNAQLRPRDIILNTVFDNNPSSTIINQIILDKNNLKYNNQEKVSDIISKTIQHLTKDRMQFTSLSNTPESVQKEIVLQMIDILYPRIQNFINNLRVPNISATINNQLLAYQQSFDYLSHDLLPNFTFIAHSLRTISDPNACSSQSASHSAANGHTTNNSPIGPNTSAQPDEL